MQGLPRHPVQVLGDDHHDAPVVAVQPLPSTDVRTPLVWDSTCCQPSYSTTSLTSGKERSKRNRTRPSAQKILWLTTGSGSPASPMSIRSRLSIAESTSARTSAAARRASLAPSPRCLEAACTSRSGVARPRRTKESPSTTRSTSPSRVARSRKLCAGVVTGRPRQRVVCWPLPIRWAATPSTCGRRPGQVRWTRPSSGTNPPQSRAAVWCGVRRSPRERRAGLPGRAALASARPHARRRRRGRDGGRQTYGAASR